MRSRRAETAIAGDPLIQKAAPSIFAPDKERDSVGKRAAGKPRQFSVEFFSDFVSRIQDRFCIFLAVAECAARAIAISADTLTLPDMTPLKCVRANR
jgi:hypothetical protein